MFTHLCLRLCVCVCKCKCKNIYMCICKCKCKCMCAFNQWHFLTTNKINLFRHGVITPECPNYLALVHSLRGTLDSINSH